jgi:hypothetical protein
MSRLSRINSCGTHLLAATAIIALLTAACDRIPLESSADMCCDDGAEPIFLRSKIDDDDGDGIILDEDFPLINDEDDDIADHTWIEDTDGVHHLFFHTEGLGSGSYIEHYISHDLRSLEYVGPALFKNESGWDSHGLWAPHVIKNGNTYYMFYTGIDGPGGDPLTKQRIGLATSTDLVIWTRLPLNSCPGTAGDGCIYECDECWTAWGDEPGSYNQQCRDPFVTWDPAGGRWVMFVTAKSDSQYGVVTVAYSHNLIDWTGAGFIEATGRLESGVLGQTTGGQAENPFVLSRDGIHYLFFTDWQDPEDSVTTADPRTIAQYATSPDLAADALGSPNWIYRGYIPDPGVNAIEVLHPGGDIWIMSQSISNERSGYWPLRRNLRLRCMVWDGGSGFGTSNVRFIGSPR